MNLFELSAKISVDDSDFKKSMENAQKVSKNVAKAVENLQNPLDKAKSGFEKISHPIETAKKGFETLKNKVETVRHPIEAFKAKVQESSTALETQRNKLSVLASGYDSAKKKVDELTKEFNKSAKESGTSSKKTQELAEKLKDAESEAANAKKEMDDFAKSVSEAGKNSGSAKDKIAGLVGGLGKVASGLGTAVATAAKVGAAAVGAAATGIAALTKSAVENYAEYEQLVGGVETLFKDSAGIVQEYAANAYKTAGMSANEYMNTVTSFSASLLQSLDGDTNAAAEKANLAITDMSDNANKMGTSMEMIQNAYQGFAKQNYTMLDNLKLGYGGTKEEMQRLLKDAEKLSGQKFDISSYADIVDAIHVVQTEMGITGTTAQEASSTIQGSVSSMKSAWSNLVTGLADDEADFGTLMDNFVGSVTTAADNIAPRIGIALNGVAKLIQEIVPVAMQYIPQIITEFLPTIGEAAVGIVTSIGTAIFDNIDQILEWGQNMLDTLLEGINSKTGNISSVVTQIVTTFGTFILENLPEIIMAGINILIALAQGIVESIPELATAATKAIIELAGYLISSENIEKIISLGADLINALSEGIGNVIDTLSSVGSDVVESIKSGISAAWNDLVSWFNGIWDSLFGNRSVDVNVNKTTSGVDGSHAGGLAYVPFNGYIAELHRGEMVLTSDEADAYRRGNSGGGGFAVYQTIYAAKQTPVELAASTAAYFQRARWAL